MAHISSINFVQSDSVLPVRRNAREKTEPTLAERVSFLATREFVSLTLLFAKILRWSEGFINSTFMPGNDRKIFHHTLALGVVSAWMHATKIAQTILAATKVAVKEKIEAAVKVIISLSDFVRAINNFAQFLFNLKIVKAVQFFRTIPVVCIFVDTLAVGLDSYDLRRTNRHLKKFQEAAGLHKKEEEYTLEDFRKGKRHIQLDMVNSQERRETSLTNRYFGVKEEAVKERLNQLQEDADHTLLKAAKLISQGRVEEGNKLKKQVTSHLHRSMKALESRIKARRFSDKLSILAGTIIFVASIILTFVPPLAPLGLAMLIGTVITAKALGYTHDKKVKKAFNVFWDQTI